MKVISATVTNEYMRKDIKNYTHFTPAETACKLFNGIRVYLHMVEREREKRIYQC